MKMLIILAQKTFLLAETLIDTVLTLFSTYQKIKMIIFLYT